MRSVRNVLAMMLMAFVLGGTATVASATSHGGTSPAPAQKPGPEKATKPPAARGGRHSGELKAVDAAGKTVTVAEKSGDVTVGITDKTTIKRGKDTVKLEDLKAGDQVTVVYTRQDGKDVARSILIKTQ